MKTCGIIGEYNPFHKGHIYHLQQAKEKSKCDCLIVITSGLYSQRGLPSLLTPNDKTKLLLENGANLILELPACYACQSADYFARYAIESLSQLDIDSLCFGSECNDINLLSSISLNKDIDVKKSLNRNQNLQLQPNDILGYSYIQWCKEKGIQPISILRNNSFKSATQTRIDAYITQQDFQSYFYLEQNWNSYYPFLKTFLQLTDTDTLSSFLLVNEGIENRLKDAAKKCETWNDFLQSCISKTYSKSRIQRTCIMILLQIKKEEFIPSFTACKVLGFDSIGQQILKQNKGKNIYTKFADMPIFLQQIELKSDALYQSISNVKLNHKVMYYEK